MKVGIGSTAETIKEGLTSTPGIWDFSVNRTQVACAVARSYPFCVPGDSGGVWRCTIQKLVYKQRECELTN